MIHARSSCLWSSDPSQHQFYAITALSYLYWCFDCSLRYIAHWLPKVHAQDQLLWWRVHYWVCWLARVRFAFPHICCKLFIVNLFIARLSSICFINFDYRIEALQLAFSVLCFIGQVEPQVKAVFSVLTFS